MSRSSDSYNDSCLMTSGLPTSRVIRKVPSNRPVSMNVEASVPPPTGLIRTLSTSQQKDQVMLGNNNTGTRVSSPPPPPTELKSCSVPSDSTVGRHEAFPMFRLRAPPPQQLHESTSQDRVIILSLCMCVMFLHCSHFTFCCGLHVCLHAIHFLLFTHLSNSFLFAYRPSVYFCVIKFWFCGFLLLFYNLHDYNLTLSLCLLTFFEKKIDKISRSSARRRFQPSLPSV